MMKRLIDCLLVVVIASLFIMLSATGVIADEPTDDPGNTIVNDYNRPPVRQSGLAATIAALGNSSLLAIIIVPLTCWLSVLFAIPRRPQPDDEIAQLIYRQLVARHQLLVSLAVVVSLAVCAGVILPRLALAATL
jgi:hypothetical protein